MSLNAFWLAVAGGIAWSIPSDAGAQVRGAPSHSPQSGEVTARSLEGNWQGVYFCGQGLTNLNLVVQAGERGELDATFNFYAHVSNSEVPSGSFAMKGALIPGTNTLVFKGTRWINRPRGYNMVDLSGEVASDRSHISGRVTSYSCTTFSLTRGF